MIQFLVGTNGLGAETMNDACSPLGDEQGREV